LISCWTSLTSYKRLSTKAGQRAEEWSSSGSPTPGRELGSNGTHIDAKTANASVSANATRLKPFYKNFLYVSVVCEAVLKTDV